VVKIKVIIKRNNKDRAILIKISKIGIKIETKLRDAAVISRAL